MFPIIDFYSHVGIAFSLSYEYFPVELFESLKESKTKDFIDNIVETLKAHIEEINKLYSYNMDKPDKFNTFFTDCGKVEPPFTHERTDKEIKKIIKIGIRFI